MYLSVRPFSNANHPVHLCGFRNMLAFSWTLTLTDKQQHILKNSCKPLRKDSLPASTFGSFQLFKVCDCVRLCSAFGIEEENTLMLIKCKWFLKKPQNSKSFYLKYSA